MNRDRAAAGSDAQDLAQRQAAILANVSDAVVVVSVRDACIVYNNAAFERLLGYAAGELLGMPIARVHAADAGSPEAVAEKLMNEARRSGRWDGEILHRRKDGGTLWTLGAISTHDLPGWGTVCLGIHRDIGERKRAEAALRASEEQLRVIAEHALDGIFFIDRAHGIKYLNPATLEWLRGLLDLPELTLEQMLGRRVWDVLGNTELSRSYRENSERAMASGESSSVEERVGRGRQARNRLTLRVPIRDAAGEVVGLLGIARDITARAQQEAARLAAMRRQRDLLVREVHHRIKNHLQGVLGLLRLRLGQSPELAAPIAEAMAQVRAIAGVYGLTGRSSQRGIDLARIVHLVAQAATGAVRVTVDLEEAGSILLREPDAVPIALVINELVTNAMKHLSPVEAPRPVRVSLRRDGDAVRVEVCNGPAWLPRGFDLAQGRGIGTGLQLLSTLAPSEGASVLIRQHADEVHAQLELRAPVVSLR